MPKRPPKAWWDRCVRSVERTGKAIDPAKICGSTWYRRMSEESRTEIIEAIEKINRRAERSKKRAKTKPAKGKKALSAKAEIAAWFKARKAKRGSK